MDPAADQRLLQVGPLRMAEKPGPEFIVLRRPIGRVVAKPVPVENLPADHHGGMLEGVAGQAPPADSKIGGRRRD